MDHAELVYTLDLKYHRSAPDAVKCPVNEPVKLKQSGISHSDHGHLVVHGSGRMLICGVCGYQLPVGF